MSPSPCPPPRCHRTKRGCRCPNSWIEFIAKTSKERREKGMKPMTRSQMSSLYRRSKKAQLFSPKQSDLVSRGCRSNTDLLCKWNADRQHIVKSQKSAKSGKKTLDANAASKIQSLLPHYPLDARTDVPCDSRTDVRTAFVKRWLPKVVGLLPNFEFEYFVKGLNDELLLFREKTTKAYLLVRLMNMDDCKVPQEQAFAAQQAFESKLGNLIPRVHFWYILDNGKERVRIFGMDPVQGTVNHLLLNPEARKRVVKIKLARKVKEVLQKLKAAKLQHGDMQFGNMSYRLDASGDIASLGLIDFEYSTPLTDETDDSEGILCDAWSYGLLPFLEKAGIPVPEWIQQVVSSGKDPREENLHLSAEFRSPFKPLRLPIIHVE